MKIILTFLCLFSATCFGHSATQPNTDRRANALQWVRASAEYQVAAQQAYRLAKMQLDSALSNPSFCADEVQAANGGFEILPPAVILDVDETVLDNSEYNARRMKIGAEYESTSWKAWGDERSATAVPGAVEFLKYAESKGVQAFFVTNRKDDLRNATYDNLRKIGVSTTLDHVMTRNEKEGRAGDKLSRRATVAASHRIALLVGDNFADLTAKNRDDFKADPKLQDGWVLLPNPVYGHWETPSASRSSPSAVNVIAPPVSTIVQQTSPAPIAYDNSCQIRSSINCDGQVLFRQVIIHQSSSAAHGGCYCPPRQ